MHENEITKIVIDLCIKIHKTLGPGLLESAYEEILAYELIKLGLSVERQKTIPIVWDDKKLDTGFRADIVINDKVIVELKSVEKVLPVHKKQLLTHIKLAKKRVGLLVNFNEALIKNGITRIANGI